MRIEFNRGIPKGAIDWLWANVGKGNRPMTRFSVIMNEDKPEYAWFYERISVDIPGDEFGASRHIPTITVKDPNMALIFALTWA